MSCRLTLVVGLIGLLPLAAAAPPPSRLSHFVTRQGGKLYEGKREFRFMGANMPGLVMPYDFTLRLPERMALPTAWEQEDGVQTAVQMGLRVIRLWSLPMRHVDEKAQSWHYILGPGEFNEDAFRTLDHLLALGNRYGVRFVVSFSASQDFFLGGFGDYARFRGKKREEFFTDAQLREDYKATVRYILTRRNHETGTFYKDDKAVFAWQFGNEMETATGEWLGEMAAYIKSIDANHLVMDTRRLLPTAPLEADPNIDIYNLHLYRGDWLKTASSYVDLLRGQRPLVVGEFGSYFTKPEEGQAALERQNTLLDRVAGESRISGAMLWSMYFHHRNGGFYWHQIMTYPVVWSYHWPGFPGGEGEREREVLAGLRSAAYRIQGLKEPPVPAPGVPEFLSPGEEPLLSWRGSAGAAGYDIERATSAAGPWTPVASNLPDAEVAYRPLWSDSGVSTGRDYFYRIAARNQSGRSAFSKVLGPVRFTTLILVDELANGKLAAASSGEMQFSNDFNALYAEHLYRASAGKGASLTWQVPGNIGTVDVWVFYSAEPAAPEFSVAAASGAAWNQLNPTADRRDLPSPPAGPASKQKRILVRYTAKVPSGNRQFKITWQGPAELDRVEVRYR